MHTKHIDIRNHFMRYMVKDKDMDIIYNRIKEKPVDITTKIFFEADHAKHANRITEGEIWELVETGRENIKNNGVFDGVVDFDLT